MKYKDIKCMAHNFGYSFVSSLNYVDGDHVVYDLRRLAKNAGGKRVSVQWFPPRIYGWSELTPRVRKAVHIYRKWLSEHMRRHRIEQNRIRELRLDCYLNKLHKVVVEVYVLDDRGKEHVCDVKY